jgi:hypothetical protein
MRIACYALHYGKEYLAWSVRSIQDAVDEIHIFYSERPSYGFTEESAVCPDTEEELRAEASRFATKPIQWHRVQASTEGEHRNHMHRLAKNRGAKLYLVVDSDEVWDPEGAKHTLDVVEAENRAGRWLARFQNFWRSFEWTVADGFRPIRVVDLRHPLTVDAYLDEAMQPAPVLHFGYAQSLALMRYKFTCHGHKAEFRPGWFEQKFCVWTPDGPHDDLHPCVNNLWRTEHTSPEVLAMLDRIMPDHPYRALRVIE